MPWTRLAVPQRVAAEAHLMASYVRSYGMAGGTKLALEVLFTGKGTLEVAGDRIPVYIRRPGTDRSVFHQVFVYREYEHVCLPQSARLIVDAGANVGYASFFFADKYPHATVVAIEPEQSNFDALIRNVGQSPRIKPLRAALWPTRQRLDIVNPGSDAWEFRVGESPDGAVQAVTLPDILERFACDGAGIDILKIDIEGAEKELFESGADRWLGRVRTLILETHDHLRAGCSAAVMAALAGRSYQRYVKAENLFFVFE